MKDSEAIARAEGRVVDNTLGTGGHHRADPRNRRTLPRATVRGTPGSVEEIARLLRIGMHLPDVPITLIAEGWCRRAQDLEEALEVAEHALRQALVDMAAHDCRHCAEDAPDIERAQRGAHDLLV